MYSNIQLLFKHYKSYKVSFFYMILLTFGSSMFESLGILFFIPVLATFLPGTMENSSLQLWVNNFFNSLSITPTISNVLILVFLLLSIKGLFMYYAQIFNIQVGNKYRVDWINKLFSSYFDTSWQYFIELKRGYLIDYLVTVLSRNMSLLLGLGNSIASIISLLVYLVFAIIVSTEITLGVIGIILIIFLFYKKILKKIKQYGQDNMMAGNELSKQVEEFVSGSKTLRAYNTESTIKEHVNNTAKERMRTYIGGYRWRIAFKVGFEFYISLTLLVLMFIFIEFMEIELTKIVVTLLLMARIMQKFKSLQQLSIVVSNLPGVALIEEQYDKLRQNTVDEISLDSIVFEKTIHIRNLFFSYDLNTKANQSMILKNISFEIPKGSMCGIIGGSGAGKTTFIDLLLGFLEPTDGDIYIDNKSFKEINKLNLLSIIGYVPQDAFLLNDTIYNNIDFYRDLNKKDIIDASMSANCLEFIEKMPKGFETLVGDNGVKLSGGQRQRICLARALAGNPQILILDEATSSLDTHSELIIKAAVEKLKSRLTIIVIAHRLSTVINADQIAVFSKGKLCEIGSPDFLLMQNGHFKKIYDKQINNN